MTNFRRVASMLLLPTVLALGVAGLSQTPREPQVPGLGRPAVVWALDDPDRASWGVQPAFGDVVGDGRPDLLVGGLDGRLRAYRNIGEGRNHAFEAVPSRFEEICDDGRIPTG